MSDQMLYTRRSVGTAEETFRTRVGTFRPDGLKGLGIDIIPRLPQEEMFRFHRCPFNCSFCYQQKGGITMTLETYQRIVEEAVEAGLKAVYILGGEPLTHPDILEMMKMAVKSFDEIILVSNIVGFAKNEFLQQFTSTVDLSKVLLVARRHIYRSDGRYTDEDRRLHERIVRRREINGQHSLDVINQAWDNVLQVWPQEKICAQCNPMKPWVHFTPTVYRWALEQGFADCVIEAVRSGTEFRRGYPWQPDSQGLDLSPSELETLFAQLAAIDKEFGVPEPAGACKPAWRNPCSLPFNSVHIDSKGDVLACGGMPSPYGNIYQGQTLNQILESPKKAVFQHPEIWVVGPCTTCSLKEYCKYGCRAEAFRGFEQYSVQCYRASDPYCWRHPKDLPPEAFYPASCESCPLKNDPTCHLAS